MKSSATDRIEKQVTLKAKVERVWQALTDYRQFSEWFRVNLEVPFVVGERSYGKITHPGYEHVTLELVVLAIEPMTRFAYTWHPYAIDPKNDFSMEPPTTVEFILTPTDNFTLLNIVESGFDAVPAHRRSEAFRMNEQGWTGQIKNIEKYVDQDKVRETTV